MDDEVCETISRRRPAFVPGGLRPFAAAPQVALFLGLLMAATFMGARPSRRRPHARRSGTLFG
jgi:hypothetical protein